MHLDKLIEQVPIFHIGRCGSTVLQEMLAQHPKIHAAGEVFSYAYPRRSPDLADASPSGFLQNSATNASRHPDRPSYFLYQVKFLHDLDMKLFESGIDSFVQTISTSDSTKAIILRRKNTLKRLVSTLIAVQRKQYHQRNGPVTDLPTVTLNPDKVHIGRWYTLLECLDDIDAQYDQLARSLKEHGIKVLTLCYEDDIETDPTKAAEKVFRNLSLTPVAVSIPTSRIQTKPLHSLLANFDVIKNRLAGTAHVWMLDG